MTPPTMDLNWREELHRAAERLTQVVHAVVREIDDTRARTAVDVARKTAEGLNQTLRRLRGAKAETTLVSTLMEAAAVYGNRTAMILLHGRRAYTSEIRGFASAEIDFELSQAAAAMSAVETKDPVVAAGTETELSPSLFQAAMRDLDSSERAYFFPLVTTGSVRALLFAGGSVQPAPLELLSEAAAMRWELLDAEARVQPKAATASMAWTEMPSSEQALHLKAQRFAKVKVAEMRVAKPGAVRLGQERGDIYQELKPEIDAARETYRKEFLDANPAMVDYLYLEIVRSLANEDDRLLGPHYPGLLA